MKSINIAHLYPKEMNIYGDNGNILALRWRLDKRGIKTNVIDVGQNDEIPTDTDIIFAGGGQDSGQEKIKADLLKKASCIKSMSSDGVVMLMICGMYQLFGHYFKTNQDSKIMGIGIIDAYTEAGEKRLIGNIVLESDYGRLVGFENHSGQTYLGDNQNALGEVIRGNGNDSSSKTEGAIVNNVFGTYLHGPLLPKNPRLADEIIGRALTKKYGNVQLEHLDDAIALKASEIASRRP